MNGITSINSIFSNYDSIVLKTLKPNVINSAEIPSTVVNLGSRSPSFGTGINAYRSIQNINSDLPNSDLGNILISLMLTQFIIELL